MMCVAPSDGGLIDAPPTADTPISAIDAPTADAGPDPGMVIVPAGTFMMGCNAAVSTCTVPEEVPYHAVMLARFEIDQTEVTQLEYSMCVAAGACAAPGMYYTPAMTPTTPVFHVTWQQASEYCMWSGKRLPTEAEWEKAARGTDGRRYPWGNDPRDCTRGVLDGCLDGWPKPVGSYPTGASPYGALDMIGNVGEWVSDWYSPTYYGASPATDPPGPVTGTEKIQRGDCAGFTIISPDGMETSLRLHRDPTMFVLGFGSTPERWVGFRCAK